MATKPGRFVPMPITGRRWVGCAIALIAQALVTVMVLQMQRLAPEVNLRISYVLVVAAVAFMYGKGPALVALLSGLLLYDGFVLHPRYILWPIATTTAGWVYFASFVINGVVAGVAMVAIRRLVMQSQETSRQLEEALEREEHFSVMLQRALLPAEPAAGDGYEVALGYSPVLKGRDVGGDFYDVFRSGKTLLALIGDVSGKGVNATSLAATIRSTVHAFAHETHRPGESLTRANAVVAPEQEVFGQFATAILVIVDAPSGRFMYSNAGHPPGVICRANGEVRFLESQSQPPLAIIDTVHYNEAYSHLEPGDKLILYTDGISEARRDSELFDLEGIGRTLSGAAGLGAREMVNLVLEAAMDWAEGRLTDDAAVVVLERKTSGL